MPTPPISYAAWSELDTRSDGDGETTRYIAFPPKGVMNSPQSTHMEFWSVNPYIGCEFGCAYCYARDTHHWMVDRAAKSEAAPATAIEATQLNRKDAFERRILVKEGAADVLAHELTHLPIGTAPIAIGTATDPYQPAERRFGLTRSLLEAFLKYDSLRIGIITKSTLIARDADLLARLAERHDIAVHISLGSVDGALLRSFEPRTPVPRARLRTIRTLAAAGVPVGLMAAPILPGITDGRDALRTLLVAARAAGASWAVHGAFRLSHGARPTFTRWLAANRPELALRYERHYRKGSNVSEEYSTALSARFGTLRDAAGLAAVREHRNIGQMDLFEAKPRIWRFRGRRAYPGNGSQAAMG